MRHPDARQPTDTLFVKAARFFSSFIFFTPMYAFLYGITAGVIAYNTEAYKFSIGFFLVMPWIHHLVYEWRRVAGFEKAIDLLWEEAWKSLPHTDYFYAGWQSAVAIDCSNRKISFITLKNLKSAPSVTVVGFDDVESAAEIVNQAQKVVAFGRVGTLTEMQIHSHNVRVSDQALKSTGIEFTLTDISKKPFFIMMSREQIKIWSRLLVKANNSTLPPTDKPIETTSLQGKNHD